MQTLPSRPRVPKGGALPPPAHEPSTGGTPGRVRQDHLPLPGLLELPAKETTGHQDKYTYTLSLLGRKAKRFLWMSLTQGWRSGDTSES